MKMCRDQSFKPKQAESDVVWSPSVRVNLHKMTGSEYMDRLEPVISSYRLQYSILNHCIRQYIG